MSSSICFGCRKELFGRAIAARGKHYHVECLRCSCCRKSLEGAFSQRWDGSLLCCTCNEVQAPKCHACRRAILEQGVSVNHSQQEAIYHPCCFTCKACAQPIRGSYCMDPKGVVFCEGCQERFLERCSLCTMPVKGEGMRLDGKVYHKQCFCCSRCRGPIEGCFFQNEAGRSRLCSHCQPKCSACGVGFGDQKYIQVGNLLLHAECFCCSDCKRCMEVEFFTEPETNPFADAGVRYRCKSCQLAAVSNKQCYQEVLAISKEERMKRTNTIDFNLVWRPFLIPSQRHALEALGLPVSAIALDSRVCLCYDNHSGRVSCGQVSTAHPDAIVSISYLVCVLRVLHEQGCEPKFSLDPKDPKDLSGTHLVKRFFPAWLRGTVVGEVLFQADYALKKLCFGDERLPGIPSVWDAVPNGEQIAARQWFTIRGAELVHSSDGCLVPHVELGVEARRLTLGEAGLMDAAFTDPSDRVVKQAAAVTARFHEVAAQLPVLAELLALARATLLAVFLLNRGCRLNDSVIAAYPLPLVPEYERYETEIPTLSKSRTRSLVETELDAVGEDRLVLKCMISSMYGGVDLSVPRQNVRMRCSQERLLAMESCLHELPLFLPKLGY